MTETGFVPNSIIYPAANSHPIAESDAIRDYLLYSIEVLRLFFRSRRIYVSGNLFLYYEEGNPKAVISPDVFVIFGVNNRKRRSYKAWQEGGKLPSFVLEITSMTTRRQDEVEKPKLYARLGVQEYFQYDPTADYLQPQLKGFHRVDEVYQPLPMESTVDHTPFIHSPMLGLDLQLQAPSQSLGVVPLPKELRFFDPQTGSKLLTRNSWAESKPVGYQ